MTRPDSYPAFRAELFARHERRATALLTSLGDLVLTSGFVYAARTRRPRWITRGLGYGLGLGVVAHLFQPGSLRREIAAIGRHPVWSIRAETERFWSGEGLRRKPARQK